MYHITDPFVVVFCKHCTAAKSDVRTIFPFIERMADDLGVQAAHAQRLMKKKPDVTSPARPQLDLAWSVAYKTLKPNGFLVVGDHDFGHMLWYGMMFLVCICSCQQDNLIPLLQELKNQDVDFRPIQGLALVLCYNLRPAVRRNLLPDLGAKHERLSLTIVRNFYVCKTVCVSSSLVSQGCQESQDYE